MVALDPAHRPTFDQVLFKSRGSAFPECFYSFLHNYVFSVNELSSTALFSKASPATPVAEAHNVSEPASLPSDSDHRLDKIWTEYESVEPYLLTETVEDTVVQARRGSLSTNGSFRRLEDIFPVELHIPNRDSNLQGTLAIRQRAAPEGCLFAILSTDINYYMSDGPALIMLSLVCANIRNCSLPSSKVRALDLLLALSSQLTDEAKLDRLIPYVIDLLHDDAATVRGAALRTLMQVVRIFPKSLAQPEYMEIWQLMLVDAITPSNASIFPEYIFPNIRYLYKDPDVSVRCILAQCIAPLADTSLRYLEMGQAMKAHGTFKLADSQEYDDALYEV